MAPTSSSSSPPPSKRARAGNSGRSGGSQAAPAGGASQQPQQQAMQKDPAKTSGVLDFLQNCLPREELLELFQDPSRGKFVCRAVLQQLPDCSQQLVVRLSCCGGIFPLTGVQVWIRHNVPQHLHTLHQWAVLQEKPPKEGADKFMIQLTPQFRAGLKASLQSLDTSPWRALTPQRIAQIEQDAIAQPGKNSNRPNKFSPKTPEDLERYTQTQWDSVLHYLVGTPNVTTEPNPAITHFLLQTRLMQPDPEVVQKGGHPDTAPLVITQKGYDFMLQDNSQQVWHFVVKYLQSVVLHKKSPQLKQEALLLLVCLSFARFGECYSASESLSKGGRVMMKDLSLFGLLHVQKIGKVSIFYPTRIAMQVVGNQNGKARGGAGMWSVSSKALTSSLSHPNPRSDGSSHLAIIVQTNFNLCAYTTSELHVSMLGLFCDVATIRRLPNAVFMIITRDSVKAAFALGIQAQQILRFLEKHAHPKLRVANPNNPMSPIPPNVMDQIYLWDRERRRVQWDETYLHECLMGGSEFQAVRKYCLKIGAYAWSSELRKQILVRYAYAVQVQTYVRKWRAKMAARGS